MRFLSCLFLILFAFPVFANGLPDSDLDGVPDEDEINIYCTNPNNRDTDGDGFSDWIELNSGYSPLDPAPKKLEECDYDNDGLSDEMELRFHTAITKKDTDGDGYEDGEEINNGYNPNSSKKEKLSKRIEINTGSQELSYFLGGVRLGKFLVSTGMSGMSTPTGNFSINSKYPKAWSPYGLWMPWWMSFVDDRIGIHELPIWPNGYREGEDHLGTPASHGCVRLGVSSAEFLYNWTPVGTEVFVY